MDERKSWNRLIVAYSGVGLVVLTIGFFLARAAGHDNFIVAHPVSTPAGSIVGVYNGIRPDPTARPAPTSAPLPSPSPGASASATPKPRASAHALPQAVPAGVTALAPEHKHSTHARSSKLVADAGGTSDGAAAASRVAGHVAPSFHTAEPEVAQQASEASAAPIAEPTEAPVAAPPARAAAQDPIFAPERVVDAQVRVAVQPDESEADRERGAHGTSVVLVTIDPKGNVVNAAVGSSSGYSSLDRAAILAARSSQFVAPKINGRPATETYRIVYDFGQ